MKQTIAAAVFALAGAGLVLPTAAGAAVFAPAQGAMNDQFGSAIIQVQRQQRQVARPAFRAAPRQSFRPAARPTARIAPNRAVRQGNFGQGRQIGRPARAIAPNRGFNPGRAAVAHRRGSRPAGYRRWHPQHLVVRRWYHRPYYGRIIGGIAIGTILAASAYYAYAAEPPAPGLCWFWADAEETQGYWDYCVDPS